MSITSLWAGVSKRYVFLVVIVLLVLLGASGYFLIFKRDSSELTTKQTLEKVLDSRMNGGSDAESKEALLTALSNTDNPQEIYRLKAALSTIYISDGKLEEAKKLYEEAVSEIDAPSHVDYIALGDISRKFGDKAATIDYYKKAMTALESVESPDKVGRMEYLRLTIEELEKN
jgi:tetratricopeptide (TPR) repeat protein